MTNEDVIEQTLFPVTRDLGGFKVHPTLPARQFAPRLHSASQGRLARWPVSGDPRR